MFSRFLIPPETGNKTPILDNVYIFLILKITSCSPCIKNQKKTKESEIISENIQIYLDIQNISQFR